MKLSKSKEVYPGAFLRLIRLTSKAFAVAFLAVTMALMPTQSVQAEGVNVIEEIIVTARKREESLQETPLAVSVLTSETIESQRIEGIRDLGTIVPGLITTESTSSTAGLVFLRGVGSGSLTPLIDQAVSVNVDGVGISSASLMNAGMFDLERIEVLRGPQALFFGKNSPGGVIALHTKDPTDEFEFELSAMYETEGEEPIFRAVMSGPLGDTLRGRLSVGWSDADNARFDAHNLDVFETGPGGVPVQMAHATGKDPVQTEKIYVIGTLLWEPSDNFSTTLKYAHLEDNQDGHTIFNFQRTQCGLGVPQVFYPVPGVDNCKMDGNVIAGGISPLLTAGDPNHPGYEGLGFHDNEEAFMSLEINYDLSNSLTLTSVTGLYDQSDQRIAESSFQAAVGLLNSSAYEKEQRSQELRLNSNFDGAFNFTVGAFYEERDIEAQNAVTLGSNIAGLPVSGVGLIPIPIGQQFTPQESTAYSVFAQVDWELNEQWLLSFGGRYSHEEKESVFEVNHFAVAPDGGPKVNVPLVEPKPDWNNLSPELTLSHQYSDDVMFFASYRTGFKSGGFDAAWKPGDLLRMHGLTGVPYENIYDEEEVDGFEFGMKSTLADGTLRFNVTLYSYEYEGLQLTKLQFSEGGVPSLRVQNAASATVEGLELETLWLTPVEGLTLTANLAYSMAEYDEFVSDCYTGQSIAAGCALNADPGTGNFTGADMSGEALSNAPDLSATLALDYVVAMGNNWNLGFNVTSSYKDDYNPTTQLYPKSWWQDSFWLTNASLSLYSSDDTWQFFVRGINLGEEYYSATGSVAPFSGNPALTGTADGSGLPDFFQFVNGGRQMMLGMTYRM